jgi:predicted HicB family RNase H-like nuclease
MKSKYYRIQKNISLTPQMHRAITEMAESLNMSVNAYIRSLIEHDLEYTEMPREYKFAKNMSFVK